MNEYDRFTRTLGQVSASEVGRTKPHRITLRVSGAGWQETREFSGPRVVLGAHPSADLQLPGDYASGAHCALELTDAGEVILRDLGSKNGTRIGVVLVREVLLPPGASFGVGQVTITLLGIADEAVPLSVDDRFGSLLGRGAKMAELFARLTRIAAADIDVLVRGESGTGKELVARGIHEASRRAHGPFIILDSTTLANGTAESVLFGHRRGTFTGADEDRAGLFEECTGGTLFIDEVGDLPPDLQPKLLRALESRTTRRLGESKFRPFNARIISATHRDLARMVNEGRFREDLYFRLARVREAIPALRERDPSNISLLAKHFLQHASESRPDTPPPSLHEDAIAALKAHDWRGNVRELQNAIEAAVQLADSPVIHAADLGLGTTVFRGSDLFDLPYKEAKVLFGRQYALVNLDRASGNRSEAARQAGLSRNGFAALLRHAGSE